MPDIPVTEGIRRLEELRGKNPQLSSLSDTQLADLAYRKSQDPRLKAYLDAGGTQRLFGEGALALESLGKKYTGPALKAVASPFVGDYGEKVAERVGEGLPRFAVDLIPQLVSARLKPVTKVGQLLPLVATAGAEYGMTKAETGSSVSATGSALSVPLSALGGYKAGQLAEKALGQAATPLIKKLVGAAGSAAGGVPGDVLEIGTSDPSKGFVENLRTFVNDPVALGAYGVQQGVFGVGMDIARTSGENAKSNRDAYVQKLVGVDELSARDNYEELTRLSTIPESTKTEQQREQERAIRKDLRAYEDFQLKQRVEKEELSNWQTVPESFATLKEQYKMLTSGQRNVMMVPKGSEWSSQGFVPMDSISIKGDKFFYNKKFITPDAIKSAYDNNQLGTLLGYGTERPANATEAVVLRNAKGVEKLAVEVDETTKPTVLANLAKFRAQDDVLRVEPKDAIVQERLKNRGQQRLFSLRDERKELPESTIFTVQLPDKEAKIPGFVQVDFFDRDVNTRSTNAVDLMLEGYKLPKLPRNLTTGQYTLSQLREMGAQEQGELLMNSRGGLPALSVFSKQSNEYMWNSLLRKMQQAFTPRVRNWNNGVKREKGARFQVDPNGEISTKGLKEFVEQAVPKEIYEHLKNAGLDTALGTNKVVLEGFVDWVRENSPEVEVKKLEPSKKPAINEYDQAVHVLDSQGFRITDNGDVLSPATYGDERLRPEDTNIRHVYGENVYRAVQTVSSYLGRNPNDFESDAATGRYGVEPISVDKMDRPVDILVRVPLEQGTQSMAEYQQDENGDVFVNKNAYKEPLYQGPHFGDSDVNVVASVRGYFSDPQTFHIFEVQSDWAQAQRKEKVVEEYPAFGSGLRRVKDHALLSSYERIAIKSAIKHALENGATRVSLADGETVSMIEGHDTASNQDIFIGSVGRHGTLADIINKDKQKRADLGLPPVKYVAEGDAIYGVLEGRVAPPQYAGMVQHYDKNLPNILKDLTGSSGVKVDLGTMDREPSPYFKSADGTPKSTQTARVYSLDNLKPEVDELFSFYNTDKQIDFEATLAATKKAFDEGTVVSTEQFLDRITKGENVDGEILLKYLNRIRDNPGLIREFALESLDNLAVRGYSEGGMVGVNTAKAARDVAFGTSAHELSHVATHRFAESQPEVYKQTHDYLNTLNSQERYTLLSQVADAIGVKDVDIEYGAGMRFDPTDPDVARKNTYEFIGTLTELMARGAYNQAKLPTLFKYLQWLPASAYRMVVNSWRYVRSYFGEGVPSAANFLNENASSELRNIINKVDEIVFRTEEAELRAQQKLQALKVFDASTFLEESPNENFGTEVQRNLSILSAGPFKDLASKWFDEGGFFKDAVHRFEDSWLSPLFRSKLYPFLAPIFHETRNYRNNIKELMHGYFAFFGQNKDKSLTYVEALDNASKIIDDLTKPGPNRSARMDRINRVLEENQKRRQETLDQGFQVVEEDKLVTRDEMITKYGMSEADADITEKFTKLPQLVMQEVMRMQQETDAAYTAKLLVSQNKKLDPKEALRRANQLIIQANDTGMTRFRRIMYEKIVAEQMKAGNNEPWVQDLAGQITALKANEVNDKQKLEMSVRQLMGDMMEFAPEIGKDGFINQLVEFSQRLGALRAQNQLIAKDAGYAPMTRRGRFLLRVYRTDVLGYELGLLREARGFDSKADLDAYVAKNKLNPEEFEVLDKKNLADRYRLFTPRSLQSVRLKAESDLRTLAEDLVASAGEADKPKVAQVMEEMLAQYKPLDKEIREIIAVKGDKFAQRRYNIEGFDRNDFLPNIMEYMNYKTVKAVKERTRARVALELERPEFDADPEMRSRTEQEVDYVLNNTQEWAGLRKLILNWYLGASPRHFVQNMFQIPMTGIPQMMSEGAGLHAYSHFFSAMKLSAKYLLEGKTGDTTLDVVLKDAEKGGITIPNAIEMFAPQTDRVQNALDSLSAYEKGSNALGDRVNYYGSRFMDSLGRVLQSTATSSEIANRRIAFIMSYLESKRTGITDARVAYDKAARFTDFTNFVGDKSNRPGFLMRAGFDAKGNPNWTHGALLTATSMQSFVLNSIGQLYAFAKNAKMNPSDRAALITGAAHLLIVAGGFGLLGAATAEQVFEQLTGISIREAMRRKLIKTGNELFGMSEEAGGRVADGLMYGLPGYLGVDASQSLGLGSPLVNFNADRPMTVLDAMGPLGGLVQKGVDTANTLMQNAWNWDTMQRAARVAAPQALNYWIRNLDNMNEGAFLDRRGQPVVNDMGATETASLALGFTPMRVARQREFQSMLKKNRDRMSREYQSTTRTIAAYLKQFEESGDATYQDKAKKAFTDFIKSVPAQDRAAMVDSVTEQLAQFREPYVRPASLKELPGYQEAEATYPEAERPEQRQLSSALEKIQVAQSLGQGQVAAQKLRGLQSTFLTKLLTDLLSQAGLPQPVSGALLKARTPSTFLSQISTPPS